MVYVSRAHQTLLHTCIHVFHVCPGKSKGLGTQYLEGKASRDLVEILALPPDSKVLVMREDLPKPHLLHMENGGDATYKLEGWLGLEGPVKRDQKPRSST